MFGEIGFKLPGVNSNTSEIHNSLAVNTFKVGGSTLVLAGNLTTSGAFASTFTMTGTTNVTFPTSGTLATTAGTISTINGTANEITANTVGSTTTLSFPSVLHSANSNVLDDGSNGCTFGSSGTASINLGNTTSPSTTAILGTVNINNSGSNATNIGTGSYAGTITIGNASSTINFPALTASEPVLTDGSKNLISGQINLASSSYVTGLLGPNNGGTGTNNGSNKISIASNVTFSGAFAFTGNLTGVTSVTFPTSGTLATTTAIYQDFFCVSRCGGM